MIMMMAMPLTLLLPISPAARKSEAAPSLTPALLLFSLVLVQKKIPPHDGLKKKTTPEQSFPGCTTTKTMIE